MWKSLLPLKENVDLKKKKKNIFSVGSERNHIVISGVVMAEGKGSIKTALSSLYA